MIKVGIVGSRKRDSLEDKLKIKKVLVRQLSLGRELFLVSGGCWKGADKFAEELASEMGLNISVHSVKSYSGMSKYEYACEAYARNTLIAEECDILLVCWDGQSRGTMDTVRKAKSMKKPIVFL